MEEEALPQTPSQEKKNEGSFQYVLYTPNIYSHAHDTLEFPRVKRRSGHDAVEEARGTRQAMIDQAQLPVLSVLLVTFYMRRSTRHNQCVHLAASIPPARPCGAVESVSLQQTRTRFLIVPAHDSKFKLLYVPIELVFAQCVSSLTLREQSCEALPYSAGKGAPV